MANKLKKICYLSMGIAMYVVFSMAVKIPLIGHIQTDLGYMVYGAFLSCFGIPGVVVGVVGCFVESLIFSGWVPIGWMIGQLFIGLICGTLYKIIQKNNYPTQLKYACYVISTIIVVTIGVGLLKTIIECGLYQIPFAIKLTKNLIAAVADMVPMAIGVIAIEPVRKRYVIKKEQK